MKFQRLFPHTNPVKIMRKPLPIIRYLNLSSSPKSCSPCNIPSCLLCSCIFPYSNFICIKNHFIYLNSNVNCCSTHVIYVIFCSNCNFIYVGKSQTTIKQRFNLHRHHLNCSSSNLLPVTNHLNSCSNSNFKVTIIFQCMDFDNFSLISSENYFINLLNPELNVLQSRDHLLIFQL